MLFYFRDFKVNYLDPGAQRIGSTYKKAVYTQYTDATFTLRSEDKQRKAEVGILGPVIRAQIRDVIKVQHRLSDNDWTEPRSRGTVPSIWFP